MAGDIARFLGRVLGAIASLAIACPICPDLPMAIYQVLKDIASVEGATALRQLRCQAGSRMDAWVRWYAVRRKRNRAGRVRHASPYKAMGARIGSRFFFGRPLFLPCGHERPDNFHCQLFPWPFLAAMIAYVSVGVGMATLPAVWIGKISKRSPSRFVLRRGAVVAARNSALAALKLRRRILTYRLPEALDHWSSLQGLGSGFFSGPGCGLL